MSLVLNQMVACVLCCGELVDVESDFGYLLYEFGELIGFVNLME
ncbi:MAG: hypothetical protein BWY82_02422 [Verrucomicrobia bacterium ADurb.Bin474]|nr:MAG: hypothetical protein BWY82_02422 [Verrucomicrobia bacterium ADurb.Bin474]